RREETNSSIEIERSPSSTGWPVGVPPTALPGDNNVDQFIGQIAIDLEKRSRADPVRSNLGRIYKVADTGAADLPGIVLALRFTGSGHKERNAEDFPQRAFQLGSERFRNGCGFGQAINFREQ